MLKHSKLFIVFVPALLIVGIALFIQITRYTPLLPDFNPATAEEQKEFIIPILPTDPIVGEKSAPITLVAFEDYACAGCQTQNIIFTSLEEQYPGRVKLIWKGLPVTQFPFPSQTAHQYAYCANKQKKFAEFKEFAFLNGQNLSPGVLDSISEQIELDIEKLQTCLAEPGVDEYIAHVESLAQILQIQSVPTFFRDNKQIQHPQTLEGWVNLLQL